MDPRLFGLLLFLSGFVFYGFVYLRYRNTDKRHMHESETEATMLDVRGVDQHINTLKGLKNSKMEGANNHEVRARNGGGSEHGVVGRPEQRDGTAAGRPEPAGLTVGRRGTTSTSRAAPLSPDPRAPHREPTGCRPQRFAAPRSSSREMIAMCP